MTVKVVLDPSAILAYARGSEAVGEIIMMVTDESDQVAVPAAALAEAHGVVKGAESAMLRLLAGSSGVTVVPLDGDSAEEVGRYARQTSLGMGQAIALMTAFHEYLLTAQGAAVRRVVDDDALIIDL